MEVIYAEGFTDHEGVRSVKRRLGGHFQRRCDHAGLTGVIAFNGDMKMDLFVIDQFVMVAYDQMIESITKDRDRVLSGDKAGFDFVRHSALMDCIMWLRRTRKYMERNYPEAQKKEANT